MKPSFTIALIGLLALPGAFAEHSKNPVRAPKRIELRDQFDVPHRLTFPSTNLVVIIMADQKGSAQVQGWVSALDSLYAGRIAVRGLADLGGVPSLLRDSVRRRLRQSFYYPVLLDWTGDIAAALGRRENEAVVLVLAPAGEIVASVNGPAGTEKLKMICAAIDPWLSRKATGSDISTQRAPTGGEP